ncbi:type II toxin-antitoxin system Phd/YefM family antitoxin [Leuconostoc inhae]|uniref:type II toxin-antitoxin system Phd/YefM family antitoxin n=1 Tax=Leuconostoc inhae TaxID=178001 RepID=UPI001C7CCEC4|nr:type II toxin-antitoxin system Phd/YefM family antitoxin [Leuconostoc inhae]
MTTQSIFSPTMARQNFFTILKQVNEDHEPVIINSPKAPEKEAVVISRADYDALQETLMLMTNGQLSDAIMREKEDSVTLSETVEGGLDWSNL